MPWIDLGITMPDVTCLMKGIMWTTLYLKEYLDPVGPAKSEVNEGWEIVLYQCF